MKRKPRPSATGKKGRDGVPQSRAAAFDEGEFLQALAEVPDVPPARHDRLSSKGRRK